VADSTFDARRTRVRYPRAFLRRAAVVTPSPSPGRVVTEADLAGLPEPAVRYLRFMDVVVAPRSGSLLAAAHGRFRMGPDGRWMACRAWQLNTAVPVRRLFHMRLRLAPGIAMTGWDTYSDGVGQMRGTLFRTIPVATGSGPRFAASELVTWLNDAVFLAPSMLLDPAVQFGSDEDDDGFRVEATDGGRTVAARVLVDERGAPRDFWTDDRYADLPGGLVRARWHTPVEELVARGRASAARGREGRLAAGGRPVHLRRDGVRRRRRQPAGAARWMTEGLAAQGTNDLRTSSRRPVVRHTRNGEGCFVNRPRRRDGADLASRTCARRGTP
jgi:hypothetical protein